MMEISIHSLIAKMRVKFKAVLTDATKTLYLPLSTEEVIYHKNTLEIRKKNCILPFWL